MKSIIEQSIFDILEIILIDDNSTDNTLDILKEYTKYDNIKVIHKNVNNGIFSCRKFSLEYCSNNYVLFIDSDDYIEQTYIEELYNEANRTLADIIQTSSVLINDEKTNNYDYIKNNIGIINEKRLTSWNTLWNRLFKKTILLNILNTPDYKLNYLEDNLIYIISLIHSKTISNIETKSSYHYNNNLSKLTSIDYITKNEQMLLSFHILNSYLVYNNLLEYKSLVDDYKYKYIYNFSKKSLARILDNDDYKYIISKVNNKNKLSEEELKCLQIINNLVNNIKNIISNLEVYFNK